MKRKAPKRGATAAMTRTAARLLLRIVGWPTLTETGRVAVLDVLRKQAKQSKM